MVSDRSLALPPYRRAALMAPVFPPLAEAPGFRPRKTKRERRAAKNEGWVWKESERFQVGAVGEESGGEAAEPAQGSSSDASATDRPDPELEAMGADFLAHSCDFRLEQGCDDVLGRLFNQAAVVNGRVVEPRPTAKYHHFQINRGIVVALSVPSLVRQTTDNSALCGLKRDIIYP
ncbi:UNVERIFIED_CONTAM: hypothetical protein FKN15_052167 [Acipenser sinensis]